MNKKHIITTIVIAIAVGIGGFFGGMQYQKGKTPAVGGNLTAAQRQQFANGGGRTGGARNFGNFAGGQIISVDSKSITVKAPDNSTKIVFYSGSTQINKPTTVDASQLTNGENVVVTGTTNSDGSVTAQNIQIRPAGQGLPGQGRGQGQSSSTPSL
jgi:hypothetical protein